MSQPPSDDVIRELSRSLRQALGVSLFGIDVIINNQTGQHAVIDINAFPGRCSLPSAGVGCVLFSLVVYFTVNNELHKALSVLTRFSGVTLSHLSQVRDSVISFCPEGKTCTRTLTVLT